MIRLTISRDGREIVLKVLQPGSYTLGPGQECDLVLDDPDLGQRQVRLTVSGQGVTFEDLSSGQTLPTAHPLALGPFEVDWQPAPTPGEHTQVGGAPPPAAPGTVVMPAPGAPQAQLRVQGGSQAGQTFSLGPGAHRVGRSQDCPVHLTDPTVSRHHAELVVSADGLAVRDLDSTSGTLVQGRSVKEARLERGQTVSFGTMTLEVVEAPQASAAKPPASPAAPAAAKPDKPARKDAAPNRRRPILYAAAGGALLLLLLAIVFSGGEKRQSQEVSQAVAQRQQGVEDDQVQRLVIINLTKGKQALEAKAYAEAITFLQNVVTADPRQTEAQELLKQARQTLAQEEAAQAKQEQEQAQRQARQSEFINQAQAAMAQGDFRRVQELAGQTLAQDPADALARHLLLQAQAGQEEAERRRRQAAETALLRENQAQALYQQGLAKLKQKDLAGAREAWKQALVLDGDKVFAVSAQVEAAMADLAQKARKEADDLAAQGGALLKKSQLPEALAAFKRALKIQPEHEQATAGLAKAQAAGERQAGRLAQEAEILDGLGKRAQACAKWRQALKLAAPEGDLHAEIKEKLPLCR
ncbi:MAG: FHA domain-containing protein [Pseudomonadota bacterium]